MARVFRIDEGAKLAPPRRRDNGWLECEGRFARVGIQEYDGANGKVQRELRLPEEVFSPATMASFQGVPVTATHPPVLLDAKNAANYSKGSVSGPVRQDGEWVVGPLMVTDAQTIGRIESGEIDELSTGYTCDLDDTQDPALVSKWGPYDAVQRNILANHQALVQAARAGPDARVRLDSKGNAMGAKADVSPPGWEGTVEAMKGHSEISNPYALAWWMEGNGDTPHDSDDGEPPELSDAERKSAVALPEAIAPHADIIRKKGSGWALLSRKTGKVLAHHKTKAGAENQERAIQAAKHARGDAQEHPMKIRLDGKEYEADSAELQAAINALQGRLDASEKRVGVLKHNLKHADARVKRIRAKYDAMQAVMKKCDACSGTGKVADAADPEKQVKCDLCDGAGEFRMHMPVSKASGQEEGFPGEEEDADPGRIGDDPDGDDDEMNEQDALEESMDPDEDMDADELAGEQQTEEESGAAAKDRKDRARKDARKRRHDEARKWAANQKKALAQRIDRVVRARAELAAVAQRFGVDATKLDAAGVRKAVIEKLGDKRVRVDGLSRRELRAKFDALVEAAGPQPTASDTVRAATSPFVVVPRADTVAVEERADGSHLEGRARMLYLLEHPQRPQASTK